MTGGGQSPPYTERKRGKGMYTVSNIVEDIQRGILAHNMVETCFSYRIVYFVNENGKGTKFCVDTPYGGLRMALENIVKENLTATNSIVISAVTTRKNGETISLLSRAYGFSLSEYFRKICEEKEKEYTNSNYGSRRVNWC